MALAMFVAITSIWAGLYEKSMLISYYIVLGLPLVFIMLSIILVRRVRQKEDVDKGYLSLELLGWAITIFVIVWSVARLL